MMTQLRKQSASPSGARTAAVPAGAVTPPPATPRQAADTAAPVDNLLNPDLFKALCDPTRAKIAVCLCKCSRPCTVSELAECCNVDLSVVSRHLAYLERCGVLDSTRQGRTVFYRVRYQALIQSFRTLANAIEVCWLACGSGCAPEQSCCGGDCAPEPGSRQPAPAPPSPSRSTPKGGADGR